MARPDPKFTYDDYQLLSDDKRYELLEGDLIVVPSPNTTHQEVVGRLYRLLCEIVEKKHLGKVFIAPYDVVLSQLTVVQPDILFISQERKAIVTEKNVQGAPDLVIEVLSNDLAKEKVIKKKLYAKYGVKEYWLVDPEKATVEVLTLTEKGYQTFSVLTKEDTLVSANFPVITFSLEKLFSYSF